MTIFCMQLMIGYCCVILTGAAHSRQSQNVHSQVCGLRQIDRFKYGYMTFDNTFIDSHGNDANAFFIKCIYYIYNICSCHVMIKIK